MDKLRSGLSPLAFRDDCGVLHKSGNLPRKRDLEGSARKIEGCAGDPHKLYRLNGLRPWDHCDRLRRAAGCIRRRETRSVADAASGSHKHTCQDGSRGTNGPQNLQSETNTLYNFCMKKKICKLAKELKWDMHVETVLSRLKRALSMMRQVRPLVTKAALLTMYETIFLPHITYCSSVWDGASTVQIQRLQRMQNRVGKLILGVQSRTPTTVVHHLLGWKDIQSIHKMHKLLVVYKSLNNMLPAHMGELFMTCRENAARATRQSSTLKLIAPRVSRECVRRSLAVAGPAVWNVILEDVRNSPSLRAFRHGLISNC